MLVKHSTLWNKTKLNKHETNRKQAYQKFRKLFTDGAACIFKKLVSCWFHAGFLLLLWLKNKKGSSMKLAWHHSYVWNLYMGILTILYTEASIAQWQRVDSKFQRSEVRIPLAPEERNQHEIRRKKRNRQKHKRTEERKMKKENRRKNREERKQKKEERSKKTRRNKHERSMKAR